MLHEEDAGQQHQGREGQSGEHSLDLSGRLSPVVAHANAQKDGQQHRHHVLHQQVDHGQLHSHGLAQVGGGGLHDQRDGEEGDEAADGRERYRQGHVALGQHREDIGRTASRTAGDEHQADGEERAQRQGACHAPGDEGQQEQLADHAGQDSFVAEHD